WFELKRSFVLAAFLVGCSTAPPKEPPLVADPPEGASEGPQHAAINTEVERGIAFIKNEKYDDAKQHLQKAIAQDPKNATAHAFLGIALEKTGDKAGAEASYKTALGLDPGLGDAAENLSALYLDDPARPDEAIAVLKPALQKSPDNTKLLVNLAYAYALKHEV